MKSSLNILLLAFLASLFFEISQGNEIEASQCGGILESDGDTLTYPSAGDSISQGDICVWTIHLETKAQFHFDFKNFSVSGGDANCTNGGIRVYAISNLLPADKPEVYTFCNEKQPDGLFYLTGSIAAVVLYSNSNSSSSFNLNWEGVSVDQLRTNHLANVLSTSSGIVRYPLIGSYEINTAATWLIRSDSNHSQMMNINLNYLRLEECDFPNDPCACEAFILYEVSSRTGLISEINRFCKNTTSVSLSDIQDTFLFAFFSDFKSQSVVEGGFEIVYYPNAVITEQPSTTTQAPTTTWGPGPIDISERCGETLRTNQGIIRYKRNENYGDNERCVWTVVLPQSSEITFTVNGSHLESGYDFIQISTFDPSHKDQEFHPKATFNGDGYEILSGSIAVITFASDEEITEFGGFELSYAGNNKPVGGFTYEASFETSGHLEYVYPPDIVAAYVFPPPNFNNENYKGLQLVLTTTHLNCDNDILKLYKFTREEGLVFMGKTWQCWSTGSVTIPSEEFVVAVLFSDPSLSMPYDEELDIVYSWSS